MKTFNLLLGTFLISLITLSSCGSKTEPAEQTTDSTAVQTTDSAAVQAEAPAKNDSLEAKAKAEAEKEAVKEELKADITSWVEEETIEDHMSKEFKEICESTIYLPWFIMSEGTPYKLNVKSAEIEESGDNCYKTTVKKVLKYEGESPRTFTETYILIQQNGKWIIDDFVLNDGKSLKHEIKYNNYGKYL